MISIRHPLIFSIFNEGLKTVCLHMSASRAYEPTEHVTFSLSGHRNSITFGLQPERIGRMLDLRSRLIGRSVVCWAWYVILCLVLDQPRYCCVRRPTQEEGITSRHYQKVLAVSWTISTCRCWSESELKANNNLVRLAAKAQMRLRIPSEPSLLAQRL